MCEDKSNVFTYLFQDICTTSFSMSSASPFSKGSAIMVILFLSIISYIYQSLIMGWRDTQLKGKTDWNTLNSAHI